MSNVINLIKKIGYVKYIYDEIFHFYGIDYILPEDAEERLDYVITQLPDKVAKIFTMRYKKLMSFEDIGAELGFTAQYANQNTSMAFQIIRFRNRLIEYLLPGYEAPLYDRNGMSKDFSDLNMAVYNCLRYGRIYTIESLTSKTKSEILRIRNMGPKKFEELEKFLKSRNLKLSGEE